MPAAIARVQAEAPELDLSFEPLFVTPLVTACLPGAEALNVELRRTILERERTTPGRRRTNDGGWQSGDDFAQWGGAAGSHVLEAALSIARRTTRPRSGPGAPPIEWKISAWANVNRAGHGNDLHIHPRAFWSGVYYVDDGGAWEDESVGGAIELSDPIGAAAVMYAPELEIAIPGAEAIGKRRVYTAAEGLLLQFPSWLPHAVGRYSGAGSRISIAWNIGL